MNEGEIKVEETKAEETTVEENVVEETVVEETVVEEKKDLDVTEMLNTVKKNIKWIAIAVAALIVICIIGSVAANSGSRFTLVQGKPFYGQTGSDTVLTLEGEEITVDEGISGFTYSADNSLAVIKDKDNTLFVLDGTNLVEVAQEVDYYVISAYGDSIAYMTEVEDRIGTLNLYNVSKKTSAVVAEEVFAGDVVLSTDGKSVAYVSDCDVEEEWFSYKITGTVYVSKKGKAGKVVAKDAKPLAVSDGGKYVFYIKDGDKLFANEKKLASGISSRVYFNQDCTEIVFNEDDDAMYYTVKMKAPVKVKKGNFTGLYAPSAMVVSYGLFSDSQYATEVYSVDSFNELLWCIDYSEAYYVFDKGEETEKLSNHLSNYQMSSDGKAMLYRSGNQLKLIEDISKSRENKVVATGLDNMSNFVASDDLQDIYYYNPIEDELCYLKKGESVRIADDAENFVYSDKYGVVYFIEDDELFCATKNAKSVKDVCGETVTTLYTANGDVYFIQSEDKVYNVNKVTGKTKFETLFELDLEDIWNWDFDF